MRDVRSRRWATALLFGSSTLVAFLAIEVGLRLYLHGCFDRPTDLLAASENPRLRYELEPHARITTNFMNPKQMEWSYTISVNADGYRGRLSDPASDAPTVVVLGDSVAMGMGVDDADAFPAVLERELRGAAQVLNWGVLGYNTAEEVELFRSRRQLASPAIVVLAFHPNDSMPAMVDYHSLLPWIKRSITIAVASELIRMGTSEGWRPTPELEAEAFAALDELVDLTTASRAALVVFQVDCGWDAGTRRFAAAFLAHARARGASVVPLDPDFCAASEYRIPRDEHPNRNGHAYLATRLLEHLRPRIAGVQLRPGVAREHATRSLRRVE
jgi:hypothetical protein